MRAVAADHAAKHLLAGSVGSVRVVAHAALLRGIRTLDYDGGYASFGINMSLTRQHNESITNNFEYVKDIPKKY